MMPEYTTYEQRDIEVDGVNYSVFFNDSFELTDKPCVVCGRKTDGNSYTGVSEVYEILSAKKMISVSLKSSLGKRIAKALKNKLESEVCCIECPLPPL